MQVCRLHKGHVMKDDITLIMYSHSSYSDVWAPFFNQADKYLQDYKKVLFSDDDLGKTPDNWGFAKYNDEDNYSVRMSTCLESVDTELCFLHHEDMFLYDKPDLKLLSEYESIVKNDSKIDFIRLLRSVDNPMFSYKNCPSLHYIPAYSQYFFSVQPTICKTDSLKKIYGETKINHLRDFEINVQKTCRDNSMNGLFHYNGENKKGMFHYDSSVYPYIATAIVKGKWNMSQYPSQLEEILKENKINVNDRGAV